MPDEPLDGGTSPSGEVRAFDLAAPAATLRAVRAAARDLAAQALAEHGFVVTAPEDHWAGTLTLPRSGVAVYVNVLLPPAFPDALPKVAVSVDRFPKRIAHVEDSGNVCVAPSTNVLLDADRPADLVAEALRRATEVLDKGMLGETDADLEAEFQAYWIPTESTPVLNLCDADGPARQIVICELTGSSKLVDQSWMVADRTEDIKAWAGNVSANLASIRHGLFIPVNASVPLALPNQPTTVRDIAQLISRYGSLAGQQLFGHAIERADYPQLLVLSMPAVPVGAGRRLAAILIMRPDPDLLRQAARGSWRGRIPAARVLSKIGRSAVGRLNLKRVDRAHLAARGGVTTRLAGATVTVVGIGAVGSEIARNLAALGVGHLRLVDQDDMNPENVHRHALGMNSTGFNKAMALTVGLRSSFPHLGIDCRTSRVEELFTSEPTFLLEADLIVLATGEETLERRLNRLLQEAPPRMHTWLEPLGIAGHAFACGGGAGAAVPRGCFECLYRPDDTLGLTNRTALTAPGQQIRRSVAGCAGTFSPFSPLDARRTAVDAAELAARLLTRAAAPPVLISWRGVHTDFEGSGYRLSGRAAQILPGARVEVSGVALVREDCPVCGAR